MATQTPQLPTESGPAVASRRLAPPTRRSMARRTGTSGSSRICPRIEGDEERLLGLAGPGSICDGGDACPDAVGVAAGWPLFGQLIAHDITADRSPLAHRAAGERMENFRSPRADLECIYGDGPVGSPFLYRRDDPAKLLLGVNDAGEEADLPRNREGIAADRRSAQRRPHLRLAAPPGDAPPAQLRGRPPPPVCRGAGVGDLRRGAAHRLLALPVGHRQRLPAASRGARACRRDRSRGPTPLPAGSRTADPARIRGRRLPLRPQPGPRGLRAQLAVGAGCACSRTCSASGRSPPNAPSSGTGSSTFPAGRRRSGRS